MSRCYSKFVNICFEKIFNVTWHCGSVKISLWKHILLLIWFINSKRQYSTYNPIHKRYTVDHSWSLSDSTAVRQNGRFDRPWFRNNEANPDLWLAANRTRPDHYHDHISWSSRIYCSSFVLFKHLPRQLRKL